MRSSSQTAAPTPPQKHHAWKLAQKDPSKTLLIAQKTDAHCQAPRFSPNGRYLAFEVRSTQKRSMTLHIRDLTSSTITTLASTTQGVEDASDIAQRELAWSPQSDDYIYASNKDADHYQLYRSRSKEALWTSTKKANDGHPSWSPDGKFVVFSSGRAGKGALYLAKLQTSKLRQLTTQASPALFPTWSPSISKMRLAYVTFSDAHSRILLIHDLSSAASTRLTKWTRPLLETQPSWSPDGKKLAFFGVKDDGSTDLYVSDLKQEPTLLAKNVMKSDSFGPTWSRDSKRIFYVQNNNEHHDKITEIDVVTSQKRLFATGTQYNNELALTEKDGTQYIAFTAYDKRDAKAQGFRKLYLKQIPKTLAPTNKSL
ncbi:MAG: PD40 domain-containing protein [Myxococcales bacterium]|nr:PD40 domain-containing protein [Myxococcales bacterium]